jgi:O-antigen chain-terminating methyltransferase
MIRNLVAQLPEIYQPIFGHPELSEQTSRPCEDRLQKIAAVYKSLERQLGRPLSVLDLGCSQGFFCLNLAQLGATVHGVDFLDKNIAVCEALSAEHPTWKLTFQVGRVEDFIEQLTPGRYDLVLGLSVFHHVAYASGADSVKRLLKRLAEATGAQIFELALREEPLYWGPAQPEDPFELVEKIGFVHLLGRIPTHLSHISRPLYVTSDRYCIFDEAVIPFSHWTLQAHAFAAPTSQASRRYFFSEHQLVKYYRLDQEQRLLNQTEHAQEVHFLKSAPPGFKVPHLLASGRTEVAAWTVMERLPGRTLLELEQQKVVFDRHAALKAVLEQLVILESAGLYHADVRTWNVLRSDDGTMHLIDYGSISNVPRDCSRPSDIFLAFLQFAQDLLSGKTVGAQPAQRVLLSPARLETPLKAAFQALWHLPREDWTFGGLRTLLDTTPPASLQLQPLRGADVWAMAMEDALAHLHHFVELVEGHEHRLRNSENRLTRTEHLLEHSEARLLQAENLVKHAEARLLQTERRSDDLERQLETLRLQMNATAGSQEQNVGQLQTVLSQATELMASSEARLQRMEAEIQTNARWREQVSATFSNAVERLGRLEAFSPRRLVTNRLALSLRRRVSGLLSRHAPGLHRQLVTRLRGVPAVSDAPAAETVFNAQQNNVSPATASLEVPRNVFRRVTVPLAGDLLSDARWASLARPRDLERFVRPAPQTEQNEALEPVTTLAQMRRSASSATFVVTLTDDDPGALERSLQSVLRQTDPAWELLLCAPESLQSLVDEWLDIDWRIRRITGGTEDEVTNLLVASWQSTAEYIGLLSPGDVVDDDLVKHISKRCSALPPCDLLYTDEAALLPDGSIRAPFYKPDWSPEHHQSVNLLGRFLAVRKSLLLNLRMDDGDAGAAREYALSLKLAERARSIGHIDEVLYVRRCEAERPAGGFFEAKDLEAARHVLQAHLADQDAGVEVVAHHPPGALQVRWPIPKDTEVTLLILTNMQERQVPGRGNLVLATNFVKSILEKSTYQGYKIIVVDDGGVPDDLRKLLVDHGHRSVSYPRTGEFSFANKSNFATSLAPSGVVLLLNDDLEVIAPDWIEALVGHALRPEVAVVGGKLLFPDHRIQHAGISTGLNGSAGHVFMNRAADQLEYGGYASVTRNYGAVTGAVMAYRKELFDQMGGFDEFFRVDYNDIDFCLRCVQAGYRVVFTPYAQLYHFHNSSFKRKHDHSVEREEFLARWHDVVERDPYCGSQLRVISAEEKSEHAA